MLTPREQILLDAFEIERDVRFLTAMAAEAIEICSMDDMVLHACEIHQLHGFADDQVGSVEHACGFFYRIERFVVNVNNDGLKRLYHYSNVAVAIQKVTEMQTYVEEIESW